MEGDRGRAGLGHTDRVHGGVCEPRGPEPQLPSSLGLFRPKPLQKHVQTSLGFQVDEPSQGRSLPLLVQLPHQRPRESARCPMRGSAFPWPPPPLALALPILHSLCLGALASALHLSLPPHTGPRVREPLEFGCAHKESDAAQVSLMSTTSQPPVLC